MDNSSVVIKYCEDYDIGRIEGLLRDSFAGLGIDPGSEVSGRNVLIKPNLLGAHRPENAVTTHPVVIEALVRILKDYDCRLWLGDSPNGVQKSVEYVWEKTGMAALCERYGIEKKYFEKEGAKIVNGLLISNPVLDADYIINIAKFKTHSLTVLTGAVKNLFGYVPGLKKTDYHRKARSREEFAETLVKIAETKRPNINIVDGIEAMAGNGPSGGYKLNVGLLAVGRDMHRVDAFLARLVNVDPRHVDTLEVAEKLSLIDLDESQEVLGDKPKKFNISGFKLPASYTKGYRESRTVQFIVNRIMSSASVKPRVKKDRCIKCGMCVRICPVQVIKFQKDGYPYVNQENCIECYCCHEACPEKAMELKDSLALRLFKFFSHRRSRDNRGEQKKHK